MRPRGVLHMFGPAGTIDAERPDESYRSLLARHWGPLMRYAASILRSDESVEDVVQAAFVRLWEQRAPRDSQHDVAFLYRTVRNLAFNERRWLRVRARWRAGTQSATWFAAEPDEEEAAERRVRDAVAALPRRRREVFELARFHGLSYRQVAETLGVSPQTVANHMSAALRDLRGALHDLLDDDSAGDG